MTNIYVGNLPYDTTEDDLVDAFAAFGEVNRATLVFDRDTGRPRGYGFVEMYEDLEALDAIKRMHGAEFMGRPLTVNEARPRGSGRGDYQRGPGAAAHGRHESPATPGHRPERRETVPAAAETASSGYSRGYSNQLYR